MNICALIIKIKIRGTLVIRFEVISKAVPVRKHTMALLLWVIITYICLINFHKLQRCFHDNE